jgi:hypothetical protein
VRRERYVNRPDLKEIFLNRDRDEGIAIAINRWGYCLRDVGSFAGLHYSWVSRIAKKAKNKT